MAHIDFDALEGARTGKRSCIILGERFVGMRDVGMKLAQDYQDTAMQIAELAPRVQELQQAQEITPEITALIDEVKALTDHSTALVRRILAAAFGEESAARLLAHDAFSPFYCRRLVNFIINGYTAAAALTPDDMEAGAPDPTPSGDAASNGDTSDNTGEPSTPTSSASTG